MGAKANVTLAHAQCVFCHVIIAVYQNILKSILNIFQVDKISLHIALLIFFLSRGTNTHTRVDSHLTEISLIGSY